MKLVKMSLAAAMVLSTAAMAEITNVKVGGDAKLYYGTNDSGTDSLFAKANSYADVAFSINATADLSKYMSAGVKAIHLTTLGLENELVSNTWSAAHPITAGTGASFLDNPYGGVEVEDVTFASEAWVALNAGKTTAKLGRQALDTPLVYSETWSVDTNTFGAAVLLNQDIENLTLVGAWVGSSNAGTGTVGAAPVTNENSDFNTFGKDGAFAAAAVYGMKDLTVQAWIFNAQGVADATWLQADYGMGALSLGLQYTTLEGKKDSPLSTNAMALKVGYTASDALSVSAAYSAVDGNAAAGFNIATSDLTVLAAGNYGTAQSKLYTEAWWNYGYVAKADTTTMNVTVEYALDKTAKVGLYVVQADQATNVRTLGATTDTAANNDLTEYTLTLSKDYEGFNATVAYISTDAKDQNLDVNGNSSAYTTLQVLLSASF